MPRALRYGIVGAGFIGGIIARAIADAPSAELVAVASRRQERAAVLAAQYPRARVFDSWQDLVAWDGLDAVYVATPTAVREVISVAAAQHGKHVLADKPFASLESLQAITAACNASGVAFMDATHFVHHPRTRQIKHERAARIGTLRAINSTFHFPSPDRGNIRYDPHQEPMGAFGDMVWYSLRAVTEFMTPGARLLNAYGIAEHDPVTGAVVRSAGILILSDGCSATWEGGYNVGACHMDLQLLGDHGTISLDDFVLDWAGGFFPPMPGYPVGFIQRSGGATPAEARRILTPGEPRQAVQMVEAFTHLAANPAGTDAVASIQISETTQDMLDRIWAQLTPLNPAGQ